jgi:low affinity Fe/Cu permease
MNVIIMMTPAALHRLSFGGEDSPRFFRLGSALVTAGPAFLAAGISAETYVVFLKAVNSPEASVMASIAAIMVLAGFWYAWPLALRQGQGTRKRCKAAFADRQSTQRSSPQQESATKIMVIRPGSTRAFLLLVTSGLLTMDTKKHWTTTLGQAAGHPAAFAIVPLYAAFWLAFDRISLDLNAIATLAVGMMTLFIQRSNRRDSLVLHAKLDELLRTDLHARSELARLDEQEPEEIEQHRDKEVRKDFTPARRDIPARATASSTYPHSPHREMINGDDRTGLIHQWLSSP